MNRRNFLKSGSLAGITLSATAIGFLPETGKDKKQVGKNGLGLDTGFPLNEITISGLQEKMQNGKLTAVSITSLYLKRIHEIDKNGPRLNAIIELNPDALSIAAFLDKERKEGKIRGPLHGIPVLVKDNINTGDKMMTTAGSLALEGNFALKDAFIIQRLRESGAVLLGKTNLSEWANFRSSRSTSGWSSRGGQTKCPYILDRNPSGSSAGSGSATAANLCAISIGTETDGSIVSPASVNGLVGIKPTVGLWSRSGIIPISSTQDTAGPMARTVRDAAILLGELTGQDDQDPITSESRGKTYKNYTQFLDEKYLTGKRIGIEKSHLKGHEGIVALLQKAIQTIKDLGAAIVEVDLMKGINEIGNAEFKVLSYEFKDGVNRYLAGTSTRIKTLQDVIDFNNKNEDKSMPYFKQETLISCQERIDLNEKIYNDSLTKTLSSRKLIVEMMDEYKLDALSGVTNGPACAIDLINGDYDTGFSLSTPAAISGFPHITVPMGFLHGLPLGISFFGKAYTEPHLLGLAYAYEQASKNRMPPGFIQDLLT
jgi:amidase